jgi:hypothetical protein
MMFAEYFSFGVEQIASPVPLMAELAHGFGLCALASALRKLGSYKT